MMYPYMILADETEIVHSQIIEKDGMKKIIVNFERPTEKWGNTDCLNCLWYVDIRYIFGLMKMENQFMFIYQKVSLLQMRLKYGLQSQVDAFWQVMEVKFPRKS